MNIDAGRAEIGVLEERVVEAGEGVAGDGRHTLGIDGFEKALA
jgi:hypothetical protein